ncbi:MAG: biosynthetic arginine decarboxylase [Elusimicrobia bacterium]|nr:biosynthetic arginine decarboxylase [Elusimicrobiota bacterium]
MGQGDNGRGAERPRGWTIEDSAALYNLKGWGLKYLDIGAGGNLQLHPRRETKRFFDLKRVVDEVSQRGIKLPVLFRFQDVLRHRVEQLNAAFKQAIDAHKYQGRYLGVYPIKVNQMREVVEEILDAGAPYQFGLEAGSKGELIAVLGMNGPEALTVINGYKDESMIRLALLGVKLGKKVIVVIEKPGEVPLLVKAVQESGVRPLIGLRGKLLAPGSGKWAASSGDKAKFGLTTPEILAAVRDLKAAGLADAVKMFHFHLGSQVTDIRAIQGAVKEGARFYAKLRKLGLELEYLDCGGGLGVDYDGTHTSQDSSTNYNLREYVNDVVSLIQEVCKQEGVPEPNIVTESGRAVVAHHSVLVVNVFGAIESGAAGPEPAASPDEHQVVTAMREVLGSIDPRNLAESLHDAQARKDEAFSLFNLGYLGLEDRARVESLFWRVCREIRRLMPTAKYLTEDLREMTRTTLDQYMCNFSVFQSLPDSWAIGQLFPIMPLQRLNEEPTRRATLADATCDSDGKVTQFPCHRKSGGALPVHPLKPGEPYYLGMFLMGAYQATMGDVHNLFGRVNEVHVFEDDEEPGGYYIEDVIEGQTIRDVLAGIQYSDFELVKNVKTAIDAHVKAGAIKPREGVDLLNQYEATMREYTYIEHPVAPASEPVSDPLPAPERPPAPAAKP